MTVDIVVSGFLCLSYLSSNLNIMHVETEQFQIDCYVTLQHVCSIYDFCGR